MRHAEHDFLEAELAAALEDLLQRRDQRLAAVETETLGTLVLDVDELLEAFGFDQLLQDRLLAGSGEGDLLVGAFDARLDPGLLLGVGNVHELDAERRAIGAGQDLQHLPDSAEFKPEHIVEEDRPVVVGGDEAVILRRQLVIVLERLGDAERVEIGVQMAAHAVGADHHDGAHRIARRLVHIGVGQRGALMTAFSLTFFSIAFSTRPQLPSSADTSSPLACSGQEGLAHEAPLAFLRTSPASSCSAAKKSCHSGLTDSGSSS
ncbi:hypothetical protein AJ88_00180 [Mesorhizobium amorphae CCBAU 01583]|nr:hypothetical protein AJ88_00180 [Mesorhizobium amorphae CCBAU 01583]